MEIRFTQSARKHRIGKVHALYVMENFPYSVVEGKNEASLQRVWIALDTRGLELEVIALELDDYLLVIHVMPTHLRKGKKRWLIN